MERKLALQFQVEHQQVHLKRPNFAMVAHVI
jgi:hypothetical protein